MILQQIGRNDAWLGVSDTQNEGSFKCIGGEIPEYSNFLDNPPPNNYGQDTEADYVYMMGLLNGNDAGKWVPKGSFSSNTYRMMAVCEIPCETGSNIQCFPNDISKVEKVAASETGDQFDSTVQEWPDYVIIRGSPFENGSRGRRYTAIKTRARYRIFESVCANNPRIRGNLACPRNSEQQAVLKRLADDLSGGFWLGVDPSTGYCNNGDSNDYSNFQQNRGSGERTVLSYSSDPATNGIWTTSSDDDTLYGICESECVVGVDANCVPDKIIENPPSTVRLSAPVQGLEFVYSSTPSSKEEAARKCDEKGGKLACPRNDWHQAVINKKVKGNSWIGLSGFKCSSGEVTKINKFADMNAKDQESVYITETGIWESADDDMRMSYICEIPCEAAGTIKNCIPKFYPAELDVNVFVRTTKISALFTSLEYVIITLDKDLLATESWERENLPPTSAPPLDINIDDRFNGQPGTKFTFYKERVEFWRARDRCNEMEAMFACPQNELQQRHVSNIIQETAWIGVTDVFEEGKFSCIDGGFPEVEPWLPTEPDDKEGLSMDADFVAVLYKPNTAYHGKWLDISVSEDRNPEYYYVCSTPCYIGEDAECMPNFLELPSTDSKSDVETEATPAPASSDNTKHDSESSASTTQEPSSEPSSVDVFPDKEEYFKEHYFGDEGRIFHYYDAKVSFWDGAKLCRNKEYSLACPTNNLQQQAISKILGSTSWLGYVDYYNEGEFLCASGGDMYYHNWADSQPDNRFNDETDADFTVVMSDSSIDVNNFKWADVGGYTYPGHEFAVVCHQDCYVGYDDYCIPNTYVTFTFLIS